VRDLVGRPELSQDRVSLCQLTEGVARSYKFAIIL